WSRPTVPAARPNVWVMPGVEPLFSVNSRDAEPAYRTEVFLTRSVPGVVPSVEDQLSGTLPVQSSRSPLVSRLAPASTDESTAVRVALAPEPPGQLYARGSLTAPSPTAANVSWPSVLPCWLSAVQVTRIDSAKT